MIVSKPYDRARAVEYARRWALARNPLFYDFTGGGGDCTNFVSQCLLAGALTMNSTPTFGWYFKSINERAPAWTGVHEIYEFLCGAGDFSPVGERIGPFCEQVGAQSAQLGDIVQLSDARGRFYHSLLITGFNDGGDILVCAHSNDALDRPLSTYTFAAARYLHVVGVNIQIFENYEYFTNLLNGASLPPQNSIYLPIPYIL